MTPDRVQIGTDGAGATVVNSRRAWGLLALAAAGPVGVALWLHRLHVPLGMPGRFVYLYSPAEVLPARLDAVPAACLLAAVLALGTWLFAGTGRVHRYAGAMLILLATVALGVWTYRAPPDHFNQHTFNMQSPSQDGAFLQEAFVVDEMRGYLATFPQRAQTPPEELRGTRVISNPPGTTLLAYGLRRLVESHGPLGAHLRGKYELGEPELRHFQETAAVGLLFTWVLAGIWLLSGVALYALGRVFLAPPAAAMFSLCGLLTPMTLLFTPGKDTAQLLTAAVPMWLWFLALRRGWLWAAALGGVLLIPACMVSLVHVWLAAIVVAASLLSARHTPGAVRALVVRSLLPAAAGALIAAGALYVLCDMNVLATARAVARSQAEVTRGAEAMPLVWQMLGIPLFLLFAGPALWACALWLVPWSRAIGYAADRDARLGLYLLVCTAGVMIATVGFTNIETPRLWIPFVPLLLLGAALRLRVFRTATAPTRWLLAGLVGLQVVFSALHWMLMDMREAETRLLSGEFFW